MFKEVMKIGDKDYTVMLTRKAMIEIEDKQKEYSKKLLKNEGAIDFLSNISDFEKSQEELKAIEKMEDGEKKNKKVREYNKKYMPLLIKSSSATEIFEEPLDPFELVYILIKNYYKNDALSKEAYEKGLCEMEEEMGLLDLEITFQDIYDQVFLEIGLLKKKLQDHKTKQKEEVLN